MCVITSILFCILFYNLFSIIFSATIKSISVLGREIEKLYAGSQVPGYHSITWDASEYSSGLYFVQMIAGDYVSTQKLMLVK